MTAQVHVPSLLARAGTASVMTLAAVGGTLFVPGAVTDAQAATHSVKALTIAASKKGRPTGGAPPGPADSTVPG